MQIPNHQLAVEPTCLDPRHTLAPSHTPLHKVQRLGLLLPSVSRNPLAGFGRRAHRTNRDLGWNPTLGRSAAETSVSTCEKPKTLAGSLQFPFEPTANRMDGLDKTAQLEVRSLGRGHLRAPEEPVLATRQKMNRTAWFVLWRFGGVAVGFSGFFGCPHRTVAGSGRHDRGPWIPPESCNLGELQEKAGDGCSQLACVVCSLVLTWPVPSTLASPGDCLKVPFL